MLVPSEAEAAFRKTLEVAPTFLWTRGMLGVTLAWQGKPEEGLAVMRQDSDEAMRVVSLPVVLHAAGHHEEADDALRKQIEHWGAE